MPTPLWPTWPRLILRAPGNQGPGKNMVHTITALAIVLSDEGP